ncbi:MAG: hypothetical protein R2726_07560 [Acidimicrobiales bacterium]
MALPRCPRCYTPIQEDWDHCHTCGLTEAEIEEALAAAEAGASSAPSAPPALPPSAPPTVPAGSDAPPPAGPGAPGPPGPSGPSGPTGPTPPSSSSSPVGDAVPSGSGLDAGPAGRGSAGATSGGFTDDAPPRPARQGPAPLAPGGISPWVVAGAIGAGVVVILLVVVLFRPKSADDGNLASTGTTAPPLGQLGIERRSTTTATTEPPSPYPPGRAGWIVYTAPDGRFKAEYPKAPALFTDKLSVGGGDVETQSFLDVDGNGGYLVVSVDLPEGANPQQTMQQVLNAWAAKKDGRVTKSAPGEGRLEPTRTAVVSGPDGVFNVTAFATPNRIFLVGSGGGDPTVYSYDHIVESFSPGV